MLLVPKNWNSFQHYKDRCPPWIKLHRDLLTNRDFVCLPLASKALAPMLWLLASESVTGEFDASIDELKFRLYLTEKEINDGLKPLIQKGFFLLASGVLAERLHDAIPETETEAEKSRAIGKDFVLQFDQFWNTYPKKQAKQSALKAFQKLKPTDDLLQTMIQAIEVQKRSDQWSKENGKFIPHPATWLNDQRWLDELSAPTQQKRIAVDL